MGYVAAYDGKARRVGWATTGAGAARGKEYYEALSKQQQSKLYVLFERIGDLGTISNPEKFRHEGNGLYCFKSFQQRLMCFMDGKDVVITHGFTKKSPKVPRSELDRGARIRREYLDSKGS